MSMYFSRVRLLPSAETRTVLRRNRAVGDAYRDHSLLWSLFAAEEQKRDFLFRRYADRPLSYYVVSERRPQLNTGVFSVETRVFDPQLEEGAWVRFDLRANPVISRKVPGKRGERHDVLMNARKSVEDKEQHAEAMEQAALQWLLKRLPQWGLKPRESSILTSAYTQHRLRQKGREISFSSLDYLGLAQVCDAVALQHALTEGVGHARGFGCGLLLVRRAEA